ncbi:unnamed protein product [Clonostachys rosea]|uniref:Saccharopine dehydrogenase [NAD(+), L-lysine-forming] n=1 Tax=Bionectria ochroleuca TaxID=29856 RepID=A0ABY6UAH6_BIOOC|nr:unnamed protein product [Clonostachys rosea]
MSTVIHLRAETKPLERRSPLSPASAKSLIEAGYLIRVEKSLDRIYRDEEFESIGAELITPGSWVNAPLEHVILGLKELPENDTPLSHNFIHFAHCFKKQDNYVEVLSRFIRGNGTLYDLEFLTDATGRRVAAFGYWAGYAGAAVALLSWSHQILSPGLEQPAVPAFDSVSALVSQVKTTLAPAIKANQGNLPRVIIIGALGRCGSGAVDHCLAAGIPETSILKWDIAETKRGGPFPEIPASDIFINCVYLGPNAAPPFTTLEALSGPERRLRVICDVSCDPNSENNPIPIYSSYSSFDKPTVSVSGSLPGPELRVVAIDHLPTLVARESSDEYSQLLLPSLLTLNHRNDEGVWKRANAVFDKKVAELSAN